MKDLEEIEQSVQQLKDYRSTHAEDDWDECVAKATKKVKCGFLNLFSKSEIDKEVLYTLLAEKHRYWVGDYGYFRDHWNWHYCVYPAMKDTPYLSILSFPGQHLVHSSKLVEIHMRYFK